MHSVEAMESAALRFLAVTCALSVAACGPSEPLKVSTVQLGRSLNSDDSIAAHTTSFHSNDTIYAAVINDSAGAGTVSARWVYAGQTVSEETKQVRFTREGATEFHLRSPSAGFPSGEYRVEFQVDGKPAGARAFRVEK
jgi:hypothetical protein